MNTGNRKTRRAYRGFTRMCADPEKPGQLIFQLPACRTPEPFEAAAGCAVLPFH